jgi:hypothetical protein
VGFDFKHSTTSNKTIDHPRVRVKASLFSGQQQSIEFSVRGEAG